MFSTLINALRVKRRSVNGPGPCQYIETMPAPEDSTAPAEALDYWRFAQAAAARIAQELPDANVTAHRLFVTLQRATSAVIYDFESSIHRPAGGTWSSYRLLFVLWVGGPLTPHRTAQLTGMSRAAVSNLAGSLEAKGLLSKTASAQDGRSLTLGLTETGLAKIREVFTQQNRREDEWSRALTEQESELLIGLLDKLMAHRNTVRAKTRR